MCDSETHAQVRFFEIVRFPPFDLIHVRHAAINVSKMAAVRCGIIRLASVELMYYIRHMQMLANQTDPVEQIPAASTREERGRQIAMMGRSNSSAHRYVVPSLVREGEQPRRSGRRARCPDYGFVGSR